MMAPLQPLEAQNLTLLGYRVENNTANEVIIHPYWQVLAAPPEDLDFQWQVQDANGRVLGESRFLPYLNTSKASNWPVDTWSTMPHNSRCHRAVPRRLSYRPAIDRDSEETPPAPAVIGTVTLSASVPPNPQPAHTLAAIFDDRIRLSGFDLRVDRKSSPPTSTQPPVASRRDVDVILYWQPFRPIDTNYHGFVHLVDTRGRPLVQTDHLPGPHFSPPTTWLPGHLNPDVYRLRIPHTTPSGIYRPSVGLYTFDDQERLPCAMARSQNRATIFPPPIKIVNLQVGEPSQRTHYRFGDMAELIGYDLDLPANGVRAGDTLTLTLYYRSIGNTAADLTRFVHLYNPQTGWRPSSIVHRRMAATRHGPGFRQRSSRYRGVVCRAGCASRQLYGVHRLLQSPEGWHTPACV